MIKEEEAGLDEQRRVAQTTHDNRTHG